MKKICLILVVSIVASMFLFGGISAAGKVLFEADFESTEEGKLPATIKSPETDQAKVIKDPTGRSGNKVLQFKKEITPANGSSEATITFPVQSADFTVEFEFYTKEGTSWAVLTKSSTFPYGPGISLVPTVVAFDGAAQLTTGAAAPREKWHKMVIVSHPETSTYDMFLDGQSAGKAGYKYRNEALKDLDALTFRTGVAVDAAEFYVDNIKVYEGAPDSSSMATPVPAPPQETAKPAEQDPSYVSNLAKAAIINSRLEKAVALMLDKSSAMVNNELKKIDESPLVVPFTENDRTLVPVRFIAENFGAKVDWEDATQKITVTLGSQVVVMNLDKTDYTVNGTAKIMDVAPKTYNDRTLIPLRAVSEALNKQVFWDDRGLIIISDTKDIFNTTDEKDFPAAVIDKINGVADGILSKPITVAYLGGSITQGGGASGEATRYINQISKGLEKILPGKKITTVNAGIGGTSSGLGVFRVNRDVISKNPDMVFIEYAINDSGRNTKQVQMTMEGIVKQLMDMPVPPMVFFIYTTSTAKAGIGDTVHQPVANYYGIPSTDLQTLCWADIDKGLYTAAEILPDGVHPSDKGHAIYASYVLDTIKADFKKGFAAPVKRDTLMTGYTFVTPHLAPYSEAKQTGTWTEQSGVSATSFEKCLVSNTPGDTLEFDFKGKSVGLYHIAAQDCGIMEITIDGTVVATVDTYKNMRVPYSQFQKFQLEDKQHKMVIKVLDNKNAASTDKYVRIGFFLAEN